MPPKTIRYWEQEFHKACLLACLYKVELSLDQFCAARGLEEEERDLLQEWFDI